MGRPDVLVIDELSLGLAPMVVTDLVRAPARPQRRARAGRAAHRAERPARAGPVLAGVRAGGGPRRRGGPGGGAGRRAAGRRRLPRRIRGGQPVSQFLEYVVTGLGIGAGFALVGSGLVAIYRVTRVVNFAQGVLRRPRRPCSPRRCWPRACRTGWRSRSPWSAAGAVGLLVGLVAIGKPGTSPRASPDHHPRAGHLRLRGRGAGLGRPAALVRRVAGGAVQFAGARVQAHYLLVIGVTVPVFARWRCSSPGPTWARRCRRAPRTGTRPGWSAST